MTSNSYSTNYTSASLVYKLCGRITQQSEDIVASTCKFVLRVLGTAPLPHDLDEFVIVERIKKKLTKQGRQKEAVSFSDLHRKLQASTVLKNRASVLTLLYNLYGTNSQFSKYAQIANELAKFASIPEISLNSNDIIISKPAYAKNKTDEIFSAFSAKDSKTLTSQLKDGRKNLYFSSVDEKTDHTATQDSSNRVAHVAAMFSTKAAKDRQQYVTWSSVKRGKEPCIPTPKPHNGEPVNFSEILQKDLLRDVLYSVQGISGSVIIWKQERNNFSVSIKSTLQNSVRKLVLRFAEMGWMYSKINQFCKVQSTEQSLGLVGQSFIAALQEEMTEFYRILATLQAQLNDEVDLKGSFLSLPLTVHRLSVWFIDPYQRLKILASVVDACKGKKGGALASALFSHLQHGDKSIQMPVRRLLKITIQPLYRMVSNWIFCGELEDAFGEFFVTTNISVPDSSMWQEKYSLNKAMIPSFLSMDQARKILSTGKAINFLRQVCQDHSFVRDNNDYRKTHDSTRVESLFTQEKDGEFQILLEKNYRKTSNLVLRVLHNEYTLMDHFQAMRNYFLLGQGDFIRHLMDLLDPELAKPANLLYSHNLSGILESAIRATNAQYHNTEILQRLDVRLLEISHGDIGWDVFSLDYHADGPIGTVFTPQCMSAYLRLFNTLWRAKRMEYVLSNISQSRTTYLKLQDRLPEVTPVTHQCHVILSQMVHFVQQMQYYMAFEVMECCWADLLQKISSAQDLDQVIAAHEQFLDTLLTRALLDEESAVLRTQLKAIYDLIIQFQRIQEKFWSQAKVIANMADERDDRIQIKTKEGAWGVNKRSAKDYESQTEALTKTAIPSTKAQLRILAFSYEDMVQKFLLMLNDHEDANLRFLSFRLDFNEHFKKRNTRLQTSLTYQHRRRSIK